MMRSIPILLIFLLFTGSVDAADSPGRFFYEGDGSVTLYNPKNGRKETVIYRTTDASYPESVREQIDDIFGLKKTESIGHMSLRFIALLDYIQDHFGEGKKTIKLNSAYRPPKYNQGLRDKGRTVAKASTHMEGMAADITITGVEGKYLWESLREKDCCGVGWYGKQSVHVDTGPARWWTGATSKVRTNISDHNKKILVRTDRDIYRPGETMTINVLRITEYPFGIKRKLQLVSVKEDKQKVLHVGAPLPPSVAELLRRTGAAPSESCIMIRNRKEGRGIRWQLPAKVGALLPPSVAELLRRTGAAPVFVRVDFCNKSNEDMPDFMLSNRIEVR